jgi:hypothetical protein
MLYYMDFNTVFICYLSTWQIVYLGISLFWASKLVSFFDQKCNKKLTKYATSSTFPNIHNHEVVPPLAGLSLLKNRHLQNSNCLFSLTIKKGCI